MDIFKILSTSSKCQGILDKSTIFSLETMLTEGLCPFSALSCFFPTRWDSLNIFFYSEVITKQRMWIDFSDFMNNANKELELTTGKCSIKCSTWCLLPLSSSIKYFVFMEDSVLNLRISIKSVISQDLLKYRTMEFLWTCFGLILSQVYQVGTKTREGCQLVSEWTLFTIS